jgi:DNA repair exonuclease SbcCD ATPase subunit
MDERLRVIRELEVGRKQAQSALAKITENLGRSLYLKQPEGEYQRLSTEIDEAAQGLAAIAADEQKMQNLDAKTRALSGEDTEQAKKLPDLYRQLGEVVLSRETPLSLSGIKQQCKSLQARARELEDRLDAVSATKFWNRLAKGAQDIVNKPLLLKCRADIERLYIEAGQRFESETSEDKDEALDELIQEIKFIKNKRQDIASDIHSAQEERVRINESYGGSTKRKAEGLRRSMGATETERNTVCQSRGEAIADLYTDRADTTPSLLSGGASELDENENKLLNDALEKRRSIKTMEERISRLRTGIALDEETAKAQKIQKSLEQEEQKLAELKKNLKQSKKRIEELEKQV